MNHRFLFVMGLISTLVASCRQPEAEQTPVEYSVMKVETTDVTLHDAYPATIRGRQDIEIYPQVEGTIHHIYIKEGQRVRRGERLFVIDQVPYQAAQLRLADGSTYPHAGRIASISGVLNLETGSGSLRAEFPTGAKVRFRPILMTALTMILGLLPMMMSTGVGANGNRTLGSGVVGGMLVGSLALLFLVPMLFIFFQYLQEKIRPIQFERSHSWAIQAELEDLQKQKSDAKG